MSVITLDPPTRKPKAPSSEPADIQARHDRNARKFMEIEEQLNRVCNMSELAFKACMDSSLVYTGDDAEQNNDDNTALFAVSEPKEMIDELKKQYRAY